MPLIILDRKFQSASQVPAHALPLYATVLQEDYDRLKAKLDICQKECIRIAELYKTDRKRFDQEIEIIMSRIDSDPNYTNALDNLSSQNQQLISENMELKEKIAKVTAILDIRDATIDKMAQKIQTLDKTVKELKQIPHTDNTIVIERLLDENNQLKEMLRHK